MVVSARKEASEIGLMMMKMGGNAFDAMIATELALAVVYPSAGNLGGGGFMVYRLNDGSIGSLDYREKAPIKATEKMFSGLLSYRSYKAVLRNCWVKPKKSFLNIPTNCMA